MLGAPRAKLAKKLDSHALGNVPDFLRKVKSYNVRGGVMSSRTAKVRIDCNALTHTYRATTCMHTVRLDKHKHVGPLSTPQKVLVFAQTDGTCMCASF